MAQYKLRERPGSAQPVVSKRSSGLNVIVILICLLLSALIWLSAVGIEYRENRDAADEETDGIEVCVPVDFEMEFA